MFCENGFICFLFHRGNIYLISVIIVDLFSIVIGIHCVCHCVSFLLLGWPVGVFGRFIERVFEWFATSKTIWMNSVEAHIIWIDLLIAPLLSTCCVARIVWCILSLSWSFCHWVVFHHFFNRWGELSLRFWLRSFS